MKRSKRKQQLPKHKASQSLAEFKTPRIQKKRRLSSSEHEQRVKAAQSHKLKSQRKRQVEKLKTMRKRTSTTAENTAALLLIYSLLSRGGIEENEAIIEASRLLHRRYSKLLKLYRHWQEHEEIIVTEKERKKKKIFHSKHIPIELLIEVEKFIYECNNKGDHVTIKLIKKFVLEPQEIFVSDSCLRNALIMMGYKWSRAKKVSTWKPTRERFAQVEKFLHDYAGVRKQEEEGGDVVLVFMDETYIYTEFGCYYTWSREGGKQRTGSKKGHKLILFHAMTKDGMLHCKDQDGNAIVDSGDVDDVLQTCELMFEGKKKGDYHKSITGETFMKWVTNRLIPTFESRYPDKSMILILDNFSVHKKGGVHPKAMRKDELAKKLIDLGYDQMEVKRGEAGNEEVNIVSKAAFYFDPRQGGPYKRELAGELENYLGSHPDLRKGDAETLLESKGHRMVWTPPLKSAVNPIERAWAIIKRFVNDKSKPGRTIQQTKADLHEALFGGTKYDGTHWQGITSRQIRHCMLNSDNLINQQIQADPRLEGSLFDLKIVENAPKQPTTLRDLRDCDSYFVGDCSDSEDEEDIECEEHYSDSEEE
jgi:hypothetical protein